MINPNEFNIEKLSINDIIDGKFMYFSNFKYDNTENNILIIKTDEISERPRIHNIDPLYIKSDFEREHFKIPLDLSKKHSKEIFEMFTKIDIFMNTNVIKKKILMETNKKNFNMVYEPIIKYNNENEPYIKIIFNSNKEYKKQGNQKIETVIFQNKNNKITKLNINTITDICSYLNYYSTCKLIIEINKIWINKTPIRREFNYGIKLECKQMEIINSINTLDYKFYLFDNVYVKEDTTCTFIINNFEYSITKKFILNYENDTTLKKCLLKKNNNIIKINFEILVESKYINIIFNIYKNGINEYLNLIHKDHDLYDALKLFLILPNKEYTLFVEKLEKSLEMKKINDDRIDEIYEEYAKDKNIEKYFKHIYNDDHFRKKLLEFNVLPNNEYNNYYNRKYNKFYDLFKETLINKIEKSGLNYKELMDSVNSLDGVISGSIILQCILNEHWNSDIDIYVYSEGNIDFRGIFNTCNNKIDETDFKDIKFSGYLKTSKNINKLIKFKLNSVPIDLIFIDKPYKYYFKEDFDFDFCKNYFDGNELKVLNYESIINKTHFYNMIDIYSIINNSKFIKKRFDKYKERGFKIIPFIDSDLKSKRFLPYEIKSILEIDAGMFDLISAHFVFHSYVNYDKYLFGNYYCEEKTDEHNNIIFLDNNIIALDNENIMTLDEENINFILDDCIITINKKYINEYGADTYLKLLINNKDFSIDKTDSDIIINDESENFKIIKDIYMLGMHDGLEKYKLEMKNNINFRNLLKFYGFLPNKKYANFLKIPHDLLK